MHIRALTQAIDLLDLHRLDPARYPALFESTALGAHGRWDMLLLHAGERIQLGRDGVVRDHHGVMCEGAFLDVLDAQRTLFQLRQQILRSTADAYRAAAELDRLLGQDASQARQSQE